MGNVTPDAVAANFRHADGLLVQCAREESIMEQEVNVHTSR